MKTQTLVWLIIMVLAGAFLVYRAGFSEHGMGRAYSRAVPKEFVNIAPAGEAAQWVSRDSDQARALDSESLAAAPRIGWVSHEQSSLARYRQSVAADPGQTEFRLSAWRTAGIWIAAFFTLAILSFVYQDNAFYKVAEAVFVGVSAAYWMVVGFWTVIVPNLLGKIWPAWVSAWALPGLAGRDLEADLLYLAPLGLGIMLLWRLSPVGGWIARWPLAFIIGVFCGLRLVTFIHADFLSQVNNSVMPVWVLTSTGTLDVWKSLEALLLVAGVLACLVYFFFSFEHKGIVGRTARVGIWVLMITFGAGFGYTVMGRIALLAIRLEFLFDDWLWLIDPTNRRVVEATVGLLGLG
jgi:hypothetical protein